MSEGKPIFDKKKSRESIAKGRRAKWWRRKGRRSSGFKYYDWKGKPITDVSTLERIASLAIPPAWNHVRICPSANGRLQAVGIDARGRIQYRYHSAYARKMERRKFAKAEIFGEYLPKLRELTSKHLSLDGIPREKVLAAILRLINSLYFRVGTELSEKHYKTYGITTLDKKHLTIKPEGTLEFDFVGKSHVLHRKVLVDQELAAVVREISSLPRGRKLFRYIDESGDIKTVKPSQINKYLKEATDPMFSSKDFRTWGGTLMAAIELAEIGTGQNEAEVKKNVVKVVKRVAKELGNTPAVCRSSYIHPAVLEAYSAGVTIDEFRPRESRRIRRLQSGLEPEEAALLKLFENGGSLQRSLPRRSP